MYFLQKDDIMKFIATEALTFFGYIISVLASVHNTYGKSYFEQSFGVRIWQL